jgi:flagellar hook-associated protein 3 FlgL
MAMHLRDSLLEANIESVGGASLRGIQQSVEHLAHMLAELGAQDTRLQITSSRLDHNIPEVLKMSSQEVDLDITEAITRLKMLEHTHQAAVATTARLLKPTLLDFLR